MVIGQAMVVAQGLILLDDFPKQCHRSVDFDEIFTLEASIKKIYVPDKQIKNLA